MGRLFCWIVMTGWLAASTALAQTPARGADQADAELERQLEEARERLEQAAREVAELSGRLISGAAVEFVEALPAFRRRAMLGLNIAPADGGGVAVLGVTPEGPADRAGLVVGDVLTGLDGRKLDRPGRGAVHQLIEGLAEVEPGAEVVLQARRDGIEREVRVQTDADGERSFALAWGGEGVPLPLIAPLPPFIHRWGEMELASLSEELEPYFGTSEGLLVVHAPPDKTLGLKDGDVLLAIGGRRPDSPAHAMRILNSYAPGEKLELEIMRRGKRQVLEIELPDRLAAPRVPRPPPEPA